MGLPQPTQYVRILVRIKQEPELLLTPPPAKTKETLGDQAFQVAASTLSNKLPANIRATK